MCYRPVDIWMSIGVCKEGSPPTDEIVAMYIIEGQNRVNEGVDTLSNITGQLVSRR